jgi:hypothetical protein
VIAKIDATENDTPVAIEGFPTIFFFPSDNKNGVSYDSGRTLASFVKFLKEKGVASKSELADLKVEEDKEEHKEEVNEEIENETEDDKPKHDEL